MATTKVKKSGGVVARPRTDESVFLPTSKLEGVRQAVASGVCARCDQSYSKNDWIFRDPTGSAVGVNCCGTPEDIREATSPAGDPSPLDFGGNDDDFEGRDFVPISQVLPIGKTKADMCRSCFQIPSSNGVCGC